MSSASVTVLGVVITGGDSTAQGTALLIAAAPAGKGRLIDASSVLPALAAVPPGVLTGTPAATVVELADPLDPQTVLTRIRAAATAEGPLFLYVAGQLQLDRKQRLPHLALARTTPSTLRYTALPWHWLASELAIRRPGTTTAVVDLVADPEAWQRVAQEGLGLGPGVRAYGRVAQPPKRECASPEYLKTFASIWRSGSRPPLPVLHEQAAAQAGAEGALLLSGEVPAPSHGGAMGGQVPMPVQSFGGPMPGAVVAAGTMVPVARAEAGFLPGDRPTAVATAAVPAPTARFATPVADGTPAMVPVAHADAGHQAPVSPNGTDAASAASISRDAGAAPAPGGPAAVAPGTRPTSEGVPRPGAHARTEVTGPEGPGTPPPPQTPAPDPHPAILAAAHAGRHHEAAAAATAWGQEALRVHGPASEQAIHWVEVRADLARLAQDPALSCELWMAAADARLTREQATDDPDVEGAVDRAHHQWEQIRDLPRARAVAPRLVALRRRVPGRQRGALQVLQRRLESLHSGPPSRD